MVSNDNVNVKKNQRNPNILASCMTWCRMKMLMLRKIKEIQTFSKLDDMVLNVTMDSVPMLYCGH